MCLKKRIFVAARWQKNECKRGKNANNTNKSLGIMRKITLYTNNKHQMATHCSYV